MGIQMVKRLQLFFNINLLILLNVCWLNEAYGVDESRIWLPKKYQAVKPKLVATAVAAEKRGRCDKVVAAEIVISKNTADDYYFVVTCRGLNQKTYNLSYLHPKFEGEPRLMAEQRNRNGGQFTSFGNDDGSGAALVVCKEDLLLEVFLMKSVHFADKPNNAEVIQTSEGKRFSFEIPFTAADLTGNQRHFNGFCDMDEEGEVDVTIKITRDSLIAVCHDELKRKTAKMSDVVVLDSISEPLQKEDAYVAIIPFDSKDPSGRILKYQAQCSVDGSGRSKIKLKARK